MAEVFMERYSTDGQSVPTLFGISLRDALADFCRDEFGRGRRKKAANGLKLSSLDAARRLCEGRPSLLTVEEALDGRPELYVEIGIRKYGDAFRQAFREQLAREQRRDVETSAAIHATGRRLHLVRDRDDAVAARASAGVGRAKSERHGGPAGDESGSAGLAGRSGRGGRP
jgi:hypothetical protein